MQVEAKDIRVPGFRSEISRLKTPHMATFLLEVGTEELPASFVGDALQAVANQGCCRTGRAIT
jgi:hypothetical protein